MKTRILNKFTKQLQANQWSKIEYIKEVFKGKYFKPPMYMSPLNSFLIKMNVRNEEDEFRKNEKENIR